MIRTPIVAGRFYPATREDCLADLQACMTAATRDLPLPADPVAGIVPHAGWMCSGRVAAGVFAALAAQRSPATVVMLSAVHRWPGREAAVYTRGGWSTPLGTVEVDAKLADRLLEASDVFVDAPEAHAQEHSLEVQMPFVQHCWPEAQVLPIMMPPRREALAAGRALAKVLKQYPRETLVIGTTDLTHYGPSYGFTPEGEGNAALRWAKEVNDRRFIDVVEALALDDVIATARAHHCACGAGAVAATMAAAIDRGADVACVTEHTTSHEVLGLRGGGDAVGYVGVVFGRRHVD